jgi:di/tricarboxylate transporter
VTPLQILVIVITFVPLLLALTNRLRTDVAALLIAFLLGGCQLLGLGVLGAPNSPQEAGRALSGLSQPVVMTLFALFIVSRALEKVGVTRWIAVRLLHLGGVSEARIVILLTSATALLSLFMNNLAAGALLLPTAIDIARRTGIAPSRLLMPVSFGSLLGGIATYFTTANIIASDLLMTANPPQAPLGVLDFTSVGGLMALGGIAYMALIGRRLLPNHAGDTPPDQPNINREAAYGFTRGFWELLLPPNSPFHDRTLAQLGIDPAEAISLRQRRQIINALEPGQTVRGGDTLILAVHEARAVQLAQASGGQLEALTPDMLNSLGLTLIEVLPAPHMGAAGRTFAEIDFRRQNGFTPLALLREGKSLQDGLSHERLRLGDSVLLIGPENNLRRVASRPDFLVLRAPQGGGISARRALFTVGVTVGAVAVSVLGVPVYLAMLGAALAIILTQTLKMDEVYASMEWNALFLIAGLYPASQAVVNTGAAALIGQQVVQWVAPLGGLGLAGGAYLLSAALTQIMGGQVTAFVTAPITISAAIALGVNPQAIAIATAMGCSASFITPISHPVNILVVGAGGYTLRDFVRVGLGLLAVCFVLLLIGMRAFWGL